MRFSAIDSTINANAANTLTTKINIINITTNQFTPSRHGQTSTLC